MLIGRYWKVYKHERASSLKTKSKRVALRSFLVMSYLDVVLGCYGWLVLFHID